MIDKSIRQHYQGGKIVDPFRKGFETIAGRTSSGATALKNQFFPEAKDAEAFAPTETEDGFSVPRIARNMIMSKIRNAALSKLGLGFLNPFLGIASLFGFDPFSMAKKTGLMQGFAPRMGEPGQTQAQYEADRELRSLEKRRANMLERREAGKDYGKTNLGKVTREIAQRKGLDINNPNEMKNIDNPIEQIQIEKSITEAPRIIPEEPGVKSPFARAIPTTPDVISPHLEGDRIMTTPTPISVPVPAHIRGGDGGGRQVTPTDMVPTKTYASPARPHGTQTERLQTLLEDDPALGLYNFANLKGMTSIADPTERAKAKEEGWLGMYDPDTDIRYVKDLEKLGTGDKTLDEQLAATVGHEGMHAFLRDPRFSDIVTDMNLSKPRSAYGEGWFDKSGKFHEGTEAYMPYEPEELLVRMRDIQKYGEAADSEWYLGDSPYAISKHPSGEYGIEGLKKTLTPIADKLATRVKQVTAPVVQDPMAGDAGVAERIAAQDRAAKAAAAQAAASKAAAARMAQERGGDGGGIGSAASREGPAGGSIGASRFRSRGGRIDKALGGRSRYL